MKISRISGVSKISSRNKEYNLMTLETKIKEGYYQRGLLDSIANRGNAENMELPPDIPRRYAALYKSGYKNRGYSKKYSDKL